MQTSTYTARVTISNTRTFKTLRMVRSVQVIERLPMCDRMISVIQSEARSPPTAFTLTARWDPKIWGSIFSPRFGSHTVSVLTAKLSPSCEYSQRLHIVQDPSPEEDRQLFDIMTIKWVDMHCKKNFGTRRNAGTIH